MRRTSAFRISIRCLVLLILNFSIQLSSSVFLPTSDQAHAASSITPTTTSPGNLGTIVTPSGNLYGITGGEQVGHNLYHSFAQFNVGTGDIAQYQTTNLVPNASTQNILSRVTDGSPSSIFGTIDSVTYYPNANFFFLNPAGLLFGPNATINVGGMVAFTTADYVRLTDTSQFNAAPGPADGQLTASQVAAFGFLGNNPAAIAIQGGILRVVQGQSLTLVGGNQEFIATDPNTGHPIPVPGGMTMTDGKLLAPGGQINVASVSSPGDISLGDFTPTPGMKMGSITFSQGATIDVSSNAGGTVRIRGGQLVIADATIFADTANAKGAPTAVDIQLTGDLSIANDLNPAITAMTTGSGEAGQVSIVSSNLTASSNTSGILTLIDTHSLGPKKAGDVSITTGNLLMNGTLQGGFSTFIDTGFESSGHGGDVTITAQNFTMNQSLINTGNFFAVFLLGVDATGSSGNVKLSTSTLDLTSSQIYTDAFSFAHGTGRSGDITVNAHDINLRFSQFSAQGHRQGGAITLSTDQLIAMNSQIILQTALMDGGPVNITGRSIDLTSGSTVVSSTGGNGNSGSITITATDHLGLLGPSASDRPSGIFSNSFGTFGTQGNAGNVVITTPRLDMTGGSRINTTTATSGHGGNVTIQTTGPITMSGETGTFAPEPLFSLGDIQPSGIFTRTIGANCSGLCGDAGNISLNTDSLSMGAGSQINSGTSTTGQGGNVMIVAGNTIDMSGTVSTGQPGGVFSRAISTSPNSGAGGNIALTAGQSVTISNGASVSASSTGPGNTGNIQIDSGNLFEMTDSSVTTEASQASGGTIKITTTPNGTVELNNSTISASVLNGAGGGGSVNIDPLYVLMQNSQILAQAVQGPGGNITINITNGGLFLPDANSVISASSQFGVNGTVTIQSPNAPVSGQIQPLGKSPLIATSLLNQRCAALAGGEFSSFTVAGRDSLPTEPGSWLASPLALATLSEDSGLGMKAEGENLETPLLSLRQIAPAGFLTQTFALDQSTSCRS